jgi:hypothetical protein
MQFLEAWIEDKVVEGAPTQAICGAVLVRCIVGAAADVKQEIHEQIPLICDALCDNVVSGGTVSTSQHTIDERGKEGRSFIVVRVVVPVIL